MNSRKLPLTLPFSAKQVNYPGTGAASTHLHKRHTEKLALMNQQRGPEPAHLKPAVAKIRPAPKPAVSEKKGNAISTQAFPLPPTLPPPAAKKPRRPRYLSQPPDLGPQFERPDTRRGGKRNGEAAELSAGGGPSNKKVKTVTARDSRKSRG
jgi:hypothetical protein